MKRVLFLEPVSDLGGVSQYILALLRHWDFEKFPAVVGAAGEGPLFVEAKKLGAAVVALPMEYAPGNFLKTCVALRRIIKEEHIDVVYAHTLKAGFLTAVVRATLPFEFIYCGHGWRFTQLGSMLPKIASYALLWFTCAMASGVVVLSEREKEFARGKLPRSGDMEVIPMHVDVPASSRVKGESSTVLTVGRIVKEKDPEGYLEIVREASRESAQVDFVWAGDGDQRASLENGLSALHVKDRVRLVGNVPKEEVYALLEKAAVFLLPSRIEVFPISMLEAVAMRVPVVVPAIGNIPELIKEKETGYLFSPGDHKMAARAVLAALALGRKERDDLTERAAAALFSSYAPEAELAKKTMRFFGR